MKTKNGGYVIIDLSQVTDLYTQLSKAVATEKPILVYGDDIPYYADSVTYDSVGDIYSIIKGGQIIEVDSSNTITKTGDKDGALMSSIVDDNGNKRFAEWDIETSEITGVTFSYGKASLSGTHLMIVLAGAVVDTSVFVGELCKIYLPDYVTDKLVPTFGSVIERKNLDLFGSDYSTQQTIVYFEEQVDYLRIYANTLTLNKDRTFRIQFDLLIDTE